MSAAELAALDLPGLPAGRTAILRKAKRERWLHETRSGRGGTTRVFAVSCLPDVTRQALGSGANLIDKTQQRVVERIRVVDRALELGRTMPQGRADELAAGDSHFSPRVIRLWRARVGEQPRAMWPELLTPGYRATAQSAEVHPDAWDYIKSDYLRGSRPAFAACYRRLIAVAKKQGWSPVPPEVTLRRKFAREVPNTVCVAKREGDTALGRLIYPAQQRDKSQILVMGLVNSDGHKVDVWVEWPDGSRGRPMLLGYQDIRSSKLLSYRIAKSESSDLVRLAFSDLVERYGVPDGVLFDNGRAFASKWLTGGTPTRFRGKVREEDPVGVLTALGVKVHWAMPYHGQSKPIERTWRNLCEDVSRHPAFEGAYLGSDTTKKPHDYDKKKAIPLADFLAVLDSAMVEQNARGDRRGDDVLGRSFDDVFREGYESRVVSKLTDEQRRVLLLCSEKLTIRSGTCEVVYLKNRYAHAALANVRGKHVLARFDPDDLHAGLYLHTMKGEYLGHAPCQDRVGFLSRDAGREHARAKASAVKTVKDLAKAEARLSASEVAAEHIQTLGTERLQPAAVAMVPGIPSRPAQPVHMGRTVAERAQDEDDRDHVLELGSVALELLRHRAG